MFGLVELEVRLMIDIFFIFLGGDLIFFLIFYLVWLMLGCIPKIGFVSCRNSSYGWVVGGGWLVVG